MKYDSKRKFKTKFLVWTTARLYLTKMGDDWDNSSFGGKVKNLDLEILILLNLDNFETSK